VDHKLNILAFKRSFYVDCIGLENGLDFNHVIIQCSRRGGHFEFFLLDLSSRSFILITYSKSSVPFKFSSSLLRFNKFLAATSRSHAILGLQCGTVQLEDGRGGGTWIFKETWGLTVQCSNMHLIFSRGLRCCWNMVGAPGWPRAVSVSPPWAMRTATASGSQHGIRAWNQTLLYFKDRPLNWGPWRLFRNFFFDLSTTISFLRPEPSPR
jgi:hypothetical protein